MRRRLILTAGVAAFAVLVALVVWQGSFTFGHFAPASVQATYLFWAVSTVIFVLTVMLGFILFRTGVKLYVERQANRPGSHIKSKLILGALALSVVPILFLVIFSISVLNRNLESWFSRPAQNMTSDLIDVGTALDREVREKLTAQAHWLASLGISQSADVYQAFCRANQIQHADILVNGNARTLCSLPEEHDSKTLIRYTVHTEQGDIALASIRPIDLAQKQRDLSRSVAEYKQLSLDRKQFRNLYILLLSLITLFILFFATWIARYMASQISTPLSALVKAAEQIRKGNLGYRVHVRSEERR